MHHSGCRRCKFQWKSVIQFTLVLLIYHACKINSHNYNIPKVKIMIKYMYIEI